VNVVNRKDYAFIQCVCVCVHHPVMTFYGHYVTDNVKMVKATDFKLYMHLYSDVLEMSPRRIFSKRGHGQGHATPNFVFVLKFFTFI